MNKRQLIDLLRADVVPALGCTEPVCVALSAAHAAKQLSGDVVRVQVSVNGGIYKNGMSAGIPNCSEVGLHYAAAIGVCLKNPEKSLELLADLTPVMLEQASALVQSNAVSVELDAAEKGLCVNCTVSTETEVCTAVIRGAHTNLVLICMRQLKRCMKNIVPLSVPILTGFMIKPMRCTMGFAKCSLL